MPAPVRPKGPQSERLVALEKLQLCVQALREAGDKGLTKQQLAEALGYTSTRQADRAIDLLEKEGARLERTRVAGFQRITLLKGPRWDESLTPEARMALRVALATLDQGGSSVWADHLQTFKTLAENRLTSRDRAVFDALRTKVLVHGSVQGGPDGEPVSPAMVDLLTILAEPVLAKSVVVTYHSASTGREKDYPVVPYLLTHDVFSGGAFLLVWDLGRKQPIQLRLSRIRAVAAPRTTSLMPKERELLDRCAHFQIGGWIGMDPPFDVKVRIRGDNWTRALLEACPALPDASVAKERGGTVLLAFRATELNGPTRWILQLGSDAEVLEPEPLKIHIRARLAEALARY